MDPRNDPSTERFSPKGVSFNASVNRACNEIVEIVSGGCTWEFLEIEWDEDVPALDRVDRCTILNKNAKLKCCVHFDSG